MNWAETLLLQCRGGVSAGSHTWISPGKHMSTREDLARREEIPQRDNPAWQFRCLSVRMTEPSSLLAK